MAAKVGSGILVVLLMLFLAYGRPLLQTNPAPAPSTGSTERYDDFQQEINQLFKQSDVDAAQYYRQLQANGDKAWQERYEQELADSKQKVEDYYAKLEQESMDAAQEIKEKYHLDMLNTQLKLMIVSLSAEERASLEQKLVHLQQEAVEVQKTTEQELKDRMNEFEQKEQERLSANLEAFKGELEETLEAEYQAYKVGLQQALDKEIARMEDALRRAVSTREY